MARYGYARPMDTLGFPAGQAQLEDVVVKGVKKPTDSDPYSRHAPKSNVPRAPISNKKPRPVGMRDDDAVAHPDIVMMPRKKTATQEVHVERKVVDQTFAPLTEEEKQMSY